MLHPKTGIFIVYGHDTELKSGTIASIEALARDGYRVRPIVLDDRANITSDSNFRNNLKSRLDEARAAVVLLSPDDLGLARKVVGSRDAIPTSEMELRPRQNVVWEYGYLDSKLSTKEYIILTRPESSELFSDTAGLYVGRVASNEDVRRTISDFVKHRLVVVKNEDPLGDKNFAIDYSNLFSDGEPSDIGAIAIFDRQFSQLDNDDDRALFLLERIVFDVYLHRPGWWQEKLKSMQFASSRLRIMQDILLFVQRYMEAWRNPLAIDRMAVATIREKVSSIEKRLTELKGEVAPIVPIVFHDYAGLTLHKLGIARTQRGETQESIADFEVAAQHLGKVLDISGEHEHASLPLWRGFAAFNQARVYRQAYNFSKQRYPEALWAKAYAEAIGHRQLWTRELLMSYNFPARLREGLDAEYIHALVTRRKDALRDKRGRIIEKSEFRIDNDFDQRVTREYDAWQKRPEQDRVRLAEAIRANFDEIIIKGPTRIDKILRRRR